MHRFETCFEKMEISSFTDLKPSNSEHITKILDIVAQYDP